MRDNDTEACAKTTQEHARFVHAPVAQRNLASVKQYLTRLVDPWLADVLAAAPAVMITGARASGKTTTALRHAASVAHLDYEREAGPFNADPDAALRERPEPLLVGLVGAWCVPCFGAYHCVHFCAGLGDDLDGDGFAVGRDRKRG